MQPIPPFAKFATLCLSSCPSGVFLLCVAAFRDLIRGGGGGGGPDHVSFSTAEEGGGDGEEDSDESSKYGAVVAISGDGEIHEILKGLVGGQEREKKPTNICSNSPFPSYSTSAESLPPRPGGTSLAAWRWGRCRRGRETP